MHIFCLHTDSAENMHRGKRNPSPDRDVVYFANGALYSVPWQKASPLSLGDILMERHHTTVYVWLATHNDRYQLMPPVSFAWIGDTIGTLMNMYAAMYTTPPHVYVHTGTDTTAAGHVCPQLTQAGVTRIVQAVPHHHRRYMSITGTALM